MRNGQDEIWQAIDDLQAGLFRAAIGPGGIRNKLIKPKSVYANTIDVSSLESVQAKTGALSVTGGITLTNTGNIHAGQTDFDTGVGYWLDLNAGIPRFSLGNSGGSKITWNGTTLAVTGTITATTGTIGGWTINATDLQGSGGVIGLASSGSIRIWSGNATPSAAPFQVDSLGNLTATAGAIGGWTIDSTSGLKLGTGASTRGISTGSVAFYAGSATPSSAPFNVTTAGALTASNITATGGSIGGITINSTSLSSTGWSLTNAGVMTSTSGSVGGLTINANDLTVPTGKKLKFGASSADYLSDNILHFEVGTSQTGKIEIVNGANTPKGQVGGSASATNGAAFVGGLGTSSYAAYCTTNGGNSTTTTWSELAAYDSGGTLQGWVQTRADGALRVKIASVTGTAQTFPTGGNPTSVIMSTDLGTTLLSIGVLAVPIEVNGTTRKFLAVG